jgi:site-specific DNA recombinase
VQGFSIDAQLKACHELAKAKGWDVVIIYTDAGYSARSDKRPDFKKMIADAQDHKFEVIIVHKFDRFSRNRADAVNYKKLLRALDVKVFSVSEPLDPEDPSGVITEGMLEVMAEWYSINLSRETQKGKRARAEAGYQNNAIPFGYVKDKGKNTIAQIDPEKIKGYHLAVKIALEGETDRHIAYALNLEGYRTTKGRPFSKDTVAAMLQSRFYLGEVSYHRRQWHKGKHEAAIDLAAWERIQAKRQARAVRPDHANLATRVFPLTTVLYCASCGSGMRGAGRATRYYRDTGKDRGIICEQCMVNAETLENQFADWIADLRLPNDWREKAIAMLGGDSSEVQRVESQRRKLDNEMKRAKQLFIAGDLTESEYNQEKFRVTSRMSNLVMPTLPDLDQAATLLGSNFREIWRVATNEERRKLVSVLVARAWVKGKRIEAIEPRAGAYFVLANAESKSPVGSAG